MHPDLVTIPAGAFLMGSDEGLPDEQPVHEVWLAQFAVAVHPVTNAEYRRFLAATGHQPPQLAAEPALTAPRQPVVGVSWFDAVAYCAWLGASTGLPCRLPNEAEREKAARGGAARARYPWGDELAAYGPATTTAGLAEVGRDPPNGYGLHNLGDLVHEWCSDWYDAHYYRTSPTQNPMGPTLGTRRVSRGGSWRHRVCVSRCAARSSLPPDRSYADYGFRIAVGGPTAVRTPGP